MSNVNWQVSESQVATIRGLLERRAVWLVMPVALRSAFLAWRLRDLGRYIRVASAPLLLLVIGLAVVESLQQAGKLSVHDESLWRFGSGFICLAVALGLLAAQSPLVQKHYPRLAMPLATLILAKFVAMPTFLVSPSAALAESFFCMIAITLVTLAMRLTLFQAAAVCICGPLLGVTVAFFFDGGPLSQNTFFGYYFVALAGVCLFVAWLMEEEEKESFLQSVLIEHAAAERERMIADLDRMAHRDSLSGLANRRELDRSLAVEWERMQREQKPLSALYIDIDHFKKFNDHYGHAKGDHCLAAVGRAIGDALLRPADLAARYGGEEFVVLLPDTDLNGALDVARRLLAGVAALDIPHAASGTASFVTVSAGVAAMLPCPALRQGDLLELADRALYEAKQSGRHRVCCAAEPSIPPVRPRSARAGCV